MLEEALTAHLVVDVIIMAIPLTEPNLSNVTELFMKRKMADRPMEPMPLIRPMTITSSPHSNQELHT